MRRIHNRTIFGCTLLVLGAAAGAGQLEIAWTARQSNQPRGIYTAAQVARLAERLCSQIEPEAPYGAFTVECYPVQGPIQPSHREWNVDCTTEARTGESGEAAEVFCKWDAETGRLILVSRSTGLIEAALPAIAASEAARRSEQWLRDLGIVDQSERIRLERSPERNSAAWLARFRVGAHHALVRVSLSGDRLQWAEY